MSLRRHNPKRDENEPEIVEVFERYGWRVQRLSETGVPDLLCARHSKMILVEVKMPKAKLNQAQQDWLDDWPHPVFVVHSVDEARAVARDKW